MASVGGVSCKFVKGVPSGPSMGVKIWRRDGVNGTASKKTAQKSGVFSFSLMKIDTNTNVKTWQTAIEALGGTIVSIIDDDGDTHTNCLIVNVSEMVKTDLYDGAAKKAAIMGVNGYIKQ